MTNDSFLKALHQSHRILAFTTISEITGGKRKELFMRLKTCLIACALMLQLVFVSLAAGQSSQLKANKSSNSNNSASANGQTASDWPMYGRDLAGSHYNSHEKTLTPA